MKKLAKTLAVISAILLLFALLVGALYRIFTDKEWVRNEYERIDIEYQSGFTVDQATFVLGKMMDYSMGFCDSLDDVWVEENELFFYEKELTHMVDVRALTTRVMRLGLAALISGAVLFVVSILILKREGVVFFSKAFLIVLGALLLVIAALGVWMAVDFNSFWHAFHAVFLDIEGSYFDWHVSNMIRICPAELFSDFIKHFALIAGLGLIIPVGVSILFICLRKKLFSDKQPLSGLSLLVYLIYSVSILGYGAYWLTRIDAFLGVGSTGLLIGSILSIINITRSRREWSAASGAARKDE